MRTFYHQTLDPSCRAIRVMLGEKRLECQLVTAQEPHAFPVLIEDNDASVPYANVIAEYLNEAYPDPDLLGYEPLLRVDVRRIAQYFSDDIDRAVTQPLLRNRQQAVLASTGTGLGTAAGLGTATGLGTGMGAGPAASPSASPSASASARVALKSFLDFVAVLDDANNWLAGPSFSIADIFAGTHIATLDFIGAIDWSEHVAVQRWYRRIKSRRSMAEILADQVDGIEPPAHYADPDF